MRRGVPMSVRLYVSATEEETARLVTNGPRRDFLELARATDAEVRYRPAGTRKGLLGKLWGPHIRQAWASAAECRAGDQVYFDGEHIGMPAAAFLALLRRKPARMVVLGHYLTHWWKLPLLWLASHVGPPTVLFVHSEVQEKTASRWLGRHWRCELLPYQVDTEFWRPGQEGGAEVMVLAAGSENRDYGTLARAASGLDARFVIAAGSHWARKLAGAGLQGSNIEYIDRPLPFAALRSLYQRAAVVVAPLDDVANQSGVTTILEAMSCGKPVVVTATRGQREVIAGPLVAEDGSLDGDAAVDRGPQRFPAFAGVEFPQAGFYVQPGDATGLRAAIELLLANDGLREELGRAGRETAAQCFGIERYTEALAKALGGLEAPPQRETTAVHA